MNRATKGQGPSTRRADDAPCWTSKDIRPVRRHRTWDGVSLLFFAGLVVGLPGAGSAILKQMRSGYTGPAGLAGFVAGLLVLSALVVLVDPARRRNTHAG